MKVAKWVRLSCSTFLFLIENSKQVDGIKQREPQRGDKGFVLLPSEAFICTEMTKTKTPGTLRWNVLPRLTPARSTYSDHVATPQTSRTEDHLKTEILNSSIVFLHESTNEATGTSCHLADADSVCKWSGGAGLFSPALLTERWRRLVLTVRRAKTDCQQLVYFAPPVFIADSLDLVPNGGSSPHHPPASFA